MTKYLLAIIVLLNACGSAGSVEKPGSDVSKGAETKEDIEWELVPGKSATMYGNNDDVRLSVVPVRKKATTTGPTHVLIRGTGTDSEFDGLVLVAKKKRRNGRYVIVSHLYGAPFTVTFHEPGNQTWEYYGYELERFDDQTVRVVDEPVDSDAILRLRSEQRSPKLREIEAPSRAERERWQNLSLEESAKTANEVCSKLDLSIDWSTVSDDLIENFAVANACGPLFVAADTFCRLHPDRAADLARSVALRCTFDGDPEEVDSYRVDIGEKGTLNFVAGAGHGSVHAILYRLREILNAQTDMYRFGEMLIVLKHSDTDTFIYSGSNDTFSLVRRMDALTTFYFNFPSGGTPGSVEIRDGKWDLHCGDEVTTLNAVSTQERDAILRAATFEEEPLWKRDPYFLSRDTRGIYYYVDKYKDEFGGKRYRVFVGRRGQLRLTKLKGVVEDSEGTLFSTDSGDLRLVVNSGDKTAVWIHGRKSTPLASVSVDRNLKLIYEELGVYYGDETGFICQ